MVTQATGAEQYESKGAFHPALSANAHAGCGGEGDDGRVVKN